MVPPWGGTRILSPLLNGNVQLASSFQQRRLIVYNEGTHLFQPT